MRTIAPLLLAGALLAPPAPVSAAGAESKFQSVTVKPGDTLWAIANTYLKDPTRWNELLKYNKLPSSDPTVALPGMSLRVPVAMIKESMRAASLVYMLNEVLSRKRETPEWKAAQERMQLYRDDGLRTLAGARARVQFVSGDLLSLDENSMAILKPRDKKDADLELQRGEVHAMGSRVITASAKITPKTKGTRFSAKVRDDLSTLVQVYTGLAAVEAHGKVQDVQAGFATEVAPDQAPSAPVRLPDTPEFRARAVGEDVFAKTLAAAPPSSGATPVGTGLVPSWKETAGGASGPRDMRQIGVDLKALEVGVPVAAYKVQASRASDFSKIVKSFSFEADQRVNLADSLPPGRYWVRVAIVDLLGAEGRYSDPRQYQVGEGGGAVSEDEVAGGRFEVIRPPEGDDYVRIPKYRLMGHADRSLTVLVNGRRMRMDEDGNFSMDVLLKEGPNSYTIVAQDARGRERAVTRKVVYEP